MMFLLGQSEKITNWLTPVWTLSVGLSIGFLIVLVLWLLLIVLGKVGGLNQLYQSKTGWIAGLIGSIVVFCVLYFGFSGPRGYWAQPNDMSSNDYGYHLILMSIFYGVGSLIAGFGFVAAVSAKRTSEVIRAPRDGFLYWTSIICILSIVFSISGFVLAANDGFNSILLVEKPKEFMESLLEIPVTGEKRAEFEVPFPTPEGGAFLSDMNFDGTNFRGMRIKSDQPIEFSVKQFEPGLNRSMYIDLPASDEFKNSGKRSINDDRFPNEFISGFYFNNQGDQPANVTVNWMTAPKIPQAGLIYWAAGSVVALYLLYFFFVAGLPKVFAVAQSTFKTEISQPVFLILLLIGSVFVVASIYIPYNTFGEDIKMYKDSGLTLLRVLGIFLAVWAASKSLAEEIEGRTALTVLSKPVSRRQFIIGKYIGIGMAIALLFIVVGLLFYVCVGYKPVYDSGESTVRDFAWETCHREAVATIPGLVLAWLEAMVFAAISVVISTRMGILANFMICFAIYILGHLTPLIVQSAEVAQAFEGVVVFGQLISIVVPVLDHFDINAAITGGVDVPTIYLGWSALYCALYGLIALLLALVLFEDRDLA